MVHEDYFQKIKNSQYISLSLNTSIFNINVKDKLIKEITIKKNNIEYKFYNKILVLACGGIENSRLLLWFKRNNINFFDKSPIGNYWMEHPFKVIGTGVGNLRH